MKKVNELYLVACQADTFSRHVVGFFGEAEGSLAREAEMVGATARAAIARYKRGDGAYTMDDILEAVEWAREAGWSPGGSE